MNVWDRKQDARELSLRNVEVWAPVEGTSFLVSNFGRVFNSKTRRFLSLGLTADGYSCLGSRLMHRLVAGAFDGTCEGLVVHHVDHDRTNNRLHNLRLATRQEHVQEAMAGEARHRSGTSTPLPADADSVLRAVLDGHVPRPSGLQRARRGRVGSSHHLSHLTDQEVEEGLRLFVEKNWTQHELAAFLDVSQPTASQIVRGVTWRHIPRPAALQASTPAPSRLLDASNPVRSLVERVHVLIAQVRQRSFRLKSDAQAIITREELIQIREFRELIERELLPAVFEFFRAHVAQYGWFYPRSDESLDDVLDQMRGRSLEDNAGISGTGRVGSTYLKARFYSFWDVDDGPVRAFSKDNLLTNVLRYRLGLNTSKLYAYTLSTGESVECQETFDINIKNVRQGFVVQRQAASFFKPTAAFEVYKRHIERDDPVVWDPSCGFGARMLGFAAAFPRGTYVGCEPATAICRDVQTLANDLIAGGHLRAALIHGQGSEHLCAVPESFDLVFTSPPYFDREKYYDEPGQCWRDYPELSVWREKYLVPTMENAKYGLKPGGKVVLNVDEARRPIVESAAARVGLRLVDELRLTLVRDHFSRAKGHTDTRSEPILVFAPV